MPKFIENHLKVGSRGVIQLKPKNFANGASLVADEQQDVDALDLHRCIEKLTGNVPSTRRIKNIAVILADRYRPRPKVLGVMFDRGYTMEDDYNGTTLFTGTPREGCAIFVGAIKELRPKNLEFDQEIEFTTIHELGHVFNLAHVSFPKSFMATSPRHKPYPLDYFKFFSRQQEWLEECDNNPLVYPGGSKFDPVLSSISMNAPLQSSSTAQVSLHINVASSIFPCSCPVELDVELQGMAGADKKFYVQDRLDPGYDEFKIWIVYPNGEKRMFRSPRHYYAQSSRVMLGKGRSIFRDISIFEGEGGTTFNKPGLYHIQAEYDLGRRGRLVSNVVTVEAVIDKTLMPSERVQLLSDRAIRRFLYHRSYKCGVKIIGALDMHLSAYPKGIGANDIRYSLVRALTNNVNTLRGKNREKVIRYLYDIKETESDSALGARQNHHVRRLIKELSGK